MKFLDRFKKKDEDNITEKERKSADIKELEIYSGMRVVVETMKGQMLFIADLQDPYKGTARLCQCSDRGIVLDEELDKVSGHLEVRLRGYNHHERKAVLMEGSIIPEDKHTWRIEKLTVVKIENERTFYRLDTDIDGTITAEEGENAGERGCKLLNISVGGASIGSACRYLKGERFLLHVKLLEDGTDMVLYCEVLRVAEKSENCFEYGCRFLELTKASREQIAQRISAACHKENELCRGERNE